MKQVNTKRANKRKQLWHEAQPYKLDYCEACGALGVKLDLHHVHHRTMTNWSNPANLMTLCYVCHRQILHQKGKEYFLEVYPHLRGRYEHLEST